jgi:methionyl-tRNA formyltransferase
MKTDVGIDTGDILMQRSIAIGRDETCGELFDRLSTLGADCIKDAITLICDNRAVYTKQDESLATLTKMVKKEHALIDWTEDSERVYNRIRAFNPAPVAYTFLNGEPLKIYKAKLSNGTGNAGEVICNTDRLEIACGNGSIEILTLQKAGGKAMETKDFLRGNKPELGSKLG